MSYIRRVFGAFFTSLAAALLVSCGSHQPLTSIADNPVADKGYYDRLLALVASEVEAAPGDLALRVKLAGYHQTLDWPAAARENMEAILQMAPKDPQAMVLAADFYIHQNDFEKSWIYAQQADRLGSTHPSLSLIKARYQYARRNLRESATYLDHYFRSGGQLPEAYLLAAELQVSRRDTSRAVALLAKGVRDNPGQQKMVRLLADIYTQRHAYDSLTHLIETYSDATSDHVTFADRLLQGYFHAGELSQAAELAANWPGGREQGFFHYGSLLLETSMPDSANSYADRLIAMDSLSAPGYLLKARYFSRRGRLGDAYNNYSMVLKIDSAHQIAFEERGIVAGKIAYLRKVREEQAAMPVFDIAPKKSDN